MGACWFQGQVATARRSVRLRALFPGDGGKAFPRMTASNGAMTSLKRARSRPSDVAAKDRE
jgi:hypothetical protein